MVYISFPHGAVIENTPANTRDAGDWGFDPWVGKIPWRRAWQLTPIFLPGEFHGQRSLAGYSPSGCKESDTTEQVTLHCAMIPLAIVSLLSLLTKLYF